MAPGATEPAPSVMPIVRSATGTTSTEVEAEAAVALWSLVAAAEVASDSSAAGTSVVSV